MSDIREFQKNRIKDATRAIDDAKISRRLIFHKGRKLIGFLVLAAVVILAVFGYNIYIKNKTYTGYEVLSISEITQNADSQYLEYNGKVLRYGMDGIVCLEKDNSKLWEISYKIRYPIVALCKNYGAVASQNGEDIYVFNESGLVGSITVNYPIKDISVASQGAVAVVMEDTDGANYIDIYESNGERKVASKTMLESNGYPLDSTISPDGQKLMVSYLDIAEETLESSIVFYNFSEVGADYIWNIVGAFDDYYDDTMIPCVTFLNDTTACAAGDNRITVFSIKETPEVLCDIPLEKKVATFFHSDTYIGLVYDNKENGGLYQLEVYDLEGKKVVSEYDINREYKSIQFVNDHILLYDNSHCILLSFDGVERFDYTFEKNFKFLEPLSLTHYIMITETTMSEIILK